MKFYCISDHESSLAFKLANILTFEPKDKREAFEIFERLTKFEDAGIILITDTMAEFLQDEITRFTAKYTKPLILEIPSYASIKKGSKNAPAET